MSGLMVCDDLIFTSRVTTTARAHGLEVAAARSAEQALVVARERHPSGVILDLHTVADLPAFLAGLRAACPAMPRVVAYGSHVNTELLRAARAAGCDPVLPRSKFVADLEAKLPEWVGVVS